MKQTIRFFAAIMIILAFTVNVTAQTTATSTPIAATADVTAGVAITPDGDLVFGNVAPGVTKTISNSGGLLAGTAGGATEREGRFDVTKGANTQVQLSFTLPAGNKLYNGLVPMDISFADDGAIKFASVTGSGTAIPFTATAPFTIANSGSTAWAFVETGFKVHIGGKVIPTNTQAAGAYAGSITLTATYN